MKVTLATVEIKTFCLVLPHLGSVSLKAKKNSLICSDLKIVYLTI